MLQQEKSLENNEMQKIGRFLLLLLVIIINIEDVLSQKPELGDGIRVRRNTINSLRENLRVLPRDGSEGWFLREQTFQLFDNPSTLPKVVQPEVLLNENDFQFEFCDNSKKLLEAYFRGFKIEGERKPWLVFAEDWSPSGIARHFGLNEYSITSDEFSYVFLRIEKSRDNRTLDRNLVLNKDNSKNLDRPNDILTNYNVPTHYINSYATGNSLYQVLVFRKDSYDYLRERMKDRGLAVFSNVIRRIFFSPNHVKDVGLIRTASGNHTVENWATENLQFPHFYPYSSLMKFYRNATLFNQLDGLLHDEVLLGLELRHLIHLF